MHDTDMQPYLARKSRKLTGCPDIPADKSISHRAVMLASLAIGESRIENLLESDDIIHSIKAMAAFGARIERWADNSWHIWGCGLGGFQSPLQDVDFGNAGTGVRLACGLIATTPIKARFTGDASLSKRPMQRIIEPLRQMGCHFDTAADQRLPIVIEGAQTPVPIVYQSPVPSAQVKSAVLLAGLNAPGETSVIETEATRDHTERMLKSFGVELSCEATAKGSIITLAGYQELKATAVSVPADPSSAAFPLVAALICDASDITLAKILMNKSRIGLVTTLQEMGADLTISDETDCNGEAIATLRAKTSVLKGIHVPAERAPSMIDEYPILAMAAANAQGTTRMEGLAELKVKESNRLTAVLEGLQALGVKVAAGDDWLEITGGAVPGGGLVKTHFDHRIAMSFLVLGLNAEAPVMIDDATAIATSFPGFAELMGGMGAAIEAGTGAGA